MQLFTTNTMNQTAWFTPGNTQVLAKTSLPASPGSIARTRSTSFRVRLLPAITAHDPVPFIVTSQYEIYNG